ncbi:Putative Zinc finger, RING-type, pleckstrin domain, von Willebrand factor, type A [Septoria linicola]|uniref:Zinc finger, RING-type, pleckstrin domain, von Willebrand factor, type A n=1 Tax=Septoria linicola TaxID=215465 RepID=A0A9Q9EIV5_9PEZI|nr:putative Zinc finger, RING-type, pleckstrin domain, von Willebrand factor, type A [Septoria linicola]USW52410.1 Putative Zinc finger, RING-type, pleckstrin domain, von Willebrand factor, type A [Septoria linicola]
MFGAKGTNRRERTFVGSVCAACEEPLEHILRGERILQLSCGHVSHEACFYEYIKEFEVQNCPSCDKPLGFDTSRGGNIDFDNLNKLVRSAQTPDARDHARETESTPVPWESDLARQPSATSLPTIPRGARDHLLPEQVQFPEYRHDRYTASQGSHGRKVSVETAALSSSDYDSQQLSSRRHDYDVQSMEAAVTSPRQIARNPIPPPIVTVRSEFPTLTKSRHQQSLTCLVTVEVVDGNWQASTRDLRIPGRSSSIPEERREPPPRLRPFSEHTTQVDSVHEDTALQRAPDELFRRVDHWHGLDFERFGKLLLHGIVRVGKDRQTWQELECYLFSEMLICVKEKRGRPNGSQTWDDAMGPESKARCTLKGSILVKKHLNQVETSIDRDVLTLHLTVVELPNFHLQFRNPQQLETWRRALMNIIQPEPPSPAHPEFDHASSEDDDYHSKRMKRVSSIQSSYGNRSQGTAPTEYTASRSGRPDARPGISLHVPVDIIVVVPVTPSMQGLKVNLLRDSLRFLVSNLGERDRMGLVTFGSGSGAAPLVGMTTKSWTGWAKAIDSIRPVGVKHLRADVVDGANIAVDLLMQRRSYNQLSHIVLISDSSTSDHDSVDFVVSRAEAAKIAIHSFGLGLTHKPDTMVAMSTRTKASYTYVKDWMMLRESLAGCLGSLQSISHQNVKVRLRLPEGSSAKFIKISGAIQITKRATGRDAEASLGDLRFGDKRDILVQLAIQPDTSTPDSIPSDPWESMISGLEALGPMDQEDTRTVSVEELPLLQADLSWGDILRDGMLSQLPRPSLLAITMLPAPSKKNSLTPFTPPIPPHPSVVQRRMELLTSDMLSRALGLVARGQNDRAHHLLAETRSILKGLGKGGLPPLPTPPPTGALPPTPRQVDSARGSPHESGFPTPPSGRRTPSPNMQDLQNPFSPSGGIDRTTMTALDSELEASLEWICHPTVFGRDTRKAVLQAIGVISSQRGYTFRTPSETLWAQRVPGVRRLADRSLEWHEVGEDDALLEVSEPNTSTGSFHSYR